MTTSPALRALPLPVQVGIEWFFASGERTKERLDGLVMHFLTASALGKCDLVDAWLEQAAAYARARGATDGF